MESSAALARDLIDSFNDDRSARPRNPVDILGRFLGIATLCTVAAVAIVLGLWLRQWAFNQAANLHFEGDIANGYSWGTQSTQIGLFNLYDHVLAANPQPHADYQLDYTPLRLTIMHTWALWAHENFSNAPTWSPQYEFNLPMLRLNTACELISALLVFLLIRLWMRRDFAARQLIDAPLPQFCGAGTAMLGALFLWFNPAVILDAHSWPQWDVWMLPFFLATALLTSLESWFTAGIVLAIGAFLKGQMLLIAPLFILWPLFELKITAALRLLGGFALASAAIAWPWMHINHDGVNWLIEIASAIVVLSPFVMIRKLHWMWLIPAVSIAILLTWPLHSPATNALKSSCALLLISLALSRLLPKQSRPAIIALSLAIATFLTIPLFSASWSWFKIGYGYGAFKFHWMATDGTYSLPWIMQIHYGWSTGPDGPITLPILHTTLTIRALLATLYTLCLILSAAGAAIQNRRHSTRFLAALMCPALCFFVLLTMMNNRYLIWAAALTSLLPAISLGMTLLGLLITAICFCGIIEIMYRVHPAVNPPLTHSLGMLQPDLAWPLLLAAAILLWIALTKSWRDRPSLGSIHPHPDWL